MDLNARVDVFLDVKFNEVSSAKNTSQVKKNLQRSFRLYCTHNRARKVNLKNDVTVDGQRYGWTGGRMDKKVNSLIAPSQTW